MKKRLLKIGRIIKNIRLSQKLTQQELSRLADVDYSTLRKVETEKTKNPSVIFCAKIANALSVSIEVIINIESPHTTMEGCSPYFSKEDDVLVELPLFII